MAAETTIKGGAPRVTKSNSNVFKRYYRLTKPGIIYGNLLSAGAGFFLGSPYTVEWGVLVALLAGTSMVIASGCVVNNYLDREIDKKMDRTRQRALVIQSIPVRNALIFAAVLGVFGFAILATFTNHLVVWIGAIGWIDYVVVYGWAKRHSVHGTLVGSISGAMPLVAGYCAASGEFDTAAALAFLLMAFWQMAHFYGIAMYRHKDYAAAGLPVLPVVKGMKTTKQWSLIYITLFTVAASLIAIYDYAGYVYLIGVLVLGFVWLARSIMNYSTVEDALWGRKMFLFSLIVLLGTSLLLALGPRLP